LFKTEKIADVLAKDPTPSTDHLVGFYPLLLDLSTMERNIPSTWILPSEHDRIFTDAIVGEVEDDDAQKSVDDDDLDDAVEITSRDLAKRCLELIGREIR
jgi:hypothetical protein